jgi:hypothetical protein
MNIVNLSIGGPDYLDEPFVDKARCRFPAFSVTQGKLLPGFVCVPDVEMADGQGLDSRGRLIFTSGFCPSAIHICPGSCLRV